MECNCGHDHTDEPNDLSIARIQAQVDQLVALIADVEETPERSLLPGLVHQLDYIPELAFSIEAAYARGEEITPEQAEMIAFRLRMEGRIIEAVANRFHPTNTQNEE